MNSLILADVAPDAGYTRNFQYCIKVTNLDKYPNYQLFAKIRSQRSDSKAGSYIQLVPGQCVTIDDGYRGVANIFAIEKSKIKSNDLKNTNAVTVLTNTKLQTELIQSKLTISPPHSVPIINDGKQVVGNYQIQSIDRNSLELTPAGDLSVQTLNTLLFPAIGIAILGWIVWKRQHKTVSE
jgi:hypothetical protein